MKTKLPFLLLCTIVLTAGFVHAQGFLNKIKNKASQEVNKLENGTTPKPTPETPKHEAEEKPNKLSANVTRTVLIKLNNDEIFDYGENCINLGTSLDQQSFILRKTSTNTCVSYKNGVRKPIACSRPDGCNEGSSALPKCNISELTFVNYTDEDYKKYVTTKTNTKEMPAMSVSEGQIDDAVKIAEAAMTPEEKADFEKEIKAQKAERDGKGISTKAMNISIPESQTINFNGKSYTVYMISKFYLSPGNKHFYAEVFETRESKETKIITSASSAFLKMPLGTSSEGIFASPDNSEFAVLERIIDMKTAEQKRLIATSKGKTYPLSDFKAAWYTPAGNHLVILLPNALYIDGVLIKKLDHEVQPCDLFINPDGKGATVKNGDTLYFDDGDFFNFPLKVEIVNVGGKSYFKWLSYEETSTNELVVYQKPY